MVDLEAKGALRVRCYDIALVQDAETYVAVCDPVTAAPAPPPSVLSVQGKMSTFGGRDDPYMGYSENLAWIETEQEAAPYPGYFVDGQPGQGYGRRLDANNATHLYLACRWDYDVTPKNFLAQPTTLCTITNPANGKSAQARPIDWGPSPTDIGVKDRVADLSPALATALGLSSDQVCVVLTPTPGNVVAPAVPPPQPPAGASTGRRVVMLTGDYVGKHVRQHQAQAAGCALSIEFHFNSNGATSMGSGVYYKPGDAASESAGQRLQAGFNQLFASEAGWGGAGKDSSQVAARLSSMPTVIPRC